MNQPLSNPRYYMISRDELHRRMLDSACNVFSVMADIALEECREEPGLEPESWVNAMVGFEGSYSGMVALYCPEPLAQRITAGLLGLSGEVDSQDMLDAMGEVVNILGGDMKLYLDSGGREVQMSIPMVFVGDCECRDEFMSEDETVACTMASGAERMMIGVQVNRGE